MIAVIVCVLLLSQIPWLSFVGSTVEWATTEKKTVTYGDLNGFEIGMTKEKVMLRIMNLGVQYVVPAPSPYFTMTYNNNLKIPDILNIDGIQVSGDHGYTVVFYLTDGKVVSIERSVPAEREELWGSLGMSVVELLKEIKIRIRSNHRLVAFPRVHPRYTVSLLSDQTEAMQTMMSRYDIWSFSVSTEAPLGARYTVYFRQGSLVRIEYMRPLFELP